MGSSQATPHKMFPFSSFSARSVVCSKSETGRLLPCWAQLVVWERLCWAPVWGYGGWARPPRAAVGTGMSQERQREVGVEQKCLVRKWETRQIWSQRMLEETSQLMKSFWSIINWKLITESWKEHKPKMGQHTFIVQLLTLNLFQ